MKQIPCGYNTQFYHFILLVRIGTSTNKMPCIIIGVESGMQTNKNIKITTLNKMSRVLKYPSKWKHTT